jgi:hypothetical protein
VDEDDGNRREQARARLGRVARAPARASHTAEVRALLPEIEAALAAGATRAEVWESLQESGAFGAGFGAFRGALARARKQAHKAPRQDPTTVGARSSAGTGEPPKRSFANWRDIDLGLPKEGDRARPEEPERPKLHFNKRDKQKE